MMDGQTPSWSPLHGRLTIIVFTKCICLLCWFTSSFRSPDSASVKSKMVYAGSKDALTRVMVGISVKVTATDLSELTVSIVQDACRKY